MNKIYIEEIEVELNSFEIYKIFNNREYSFFLDSGMNPERLGRYSFIGFDPFIRIENKNNINTIFDGENKEIIIDNPFNVLKQILSKYKIENNTEIPFVGGAVGYFSYDLCHQVEILPKKAIDDLEIPEISIGLYDGIIIIDHLMNKKYIASAGLPSFSENEALEKIKKIKSMILNNHLSINVDYLDELYKDNEVFIKSNFTKDEYCEAIKKAQYYIRQGDIYQMNMTQRFSTKINRHPLNIYEDLRTINPAPFASFLDCGEFQIVSSSPERFLQLRNGKIETRPIKGTMPRSSDPVEDEKNGNILKESVKDRAENLMIVDLMRNDIGRVCKIGSVEVPELFCIEKYPTVFHLVSTVIGDLREDCDAIDCIKATFPGGSITGAPKVRAMEVIDELEPNTRNIYTGSIGYIGFDGDMDINIVIRTILVKDSIAYYGVGGGIVWDSVPEKEYQETLDKGYALYKVLSNVIVKNQK